MSWAQSYSAQLLPEGFPQRLPEPKLRIGDRVRWHPIPAEDFGTVVGLQYAPAEHLRAWAWRYTIWLDLESPSRAWICTDTAWEADLEPLATEQYSVAAEVSQE